MSGHFEIVCCPECETAQTASVQHTKPHWTYVHECKECGYVIMESEWEPWVDPSVEEFVKRHGK